jgi:hypothetical protein
MYLNVFDDINYIDLYTVGATVVQLAQKNQLLNTKILQYKIYNESILINTAKYDISFKSPMVNWSMFSYYNRQFFLDVC